MQIYCNTKYVHMKRNLDEVKSVFEQDKNEIIKKYNGSGGGIGKEGNNYVIVIYSDHPSTFSDSNLYWKDIPVRVKFTGPIKLQ